MDKKCPRLSQAWHCHNQISATRVLRINKVICVKAEIFCEYPIYNWTWYLNMPLCSLLFILLYILLRQQNNANLLANFKWVFSIWWQTIIWQRAILTFRKYFSDFSLHQLNRSLYNFNTITGMYFYLRNKRSDL